MWRVSLRRNCLRVPNTINTIYYLFTMKLYLYKSQTDSNTNVQRNETILTEDSNDEVEANTNVIPQETKRTDASTYTQTKPNGSSNMRSTATLKPVGTRLSSTGKATRFIVEQ